MPAEKSDARGQTGRREKLTGLALDNSGSGFAQACSERRQLELSWLAAKSLVRIDATLTDLVTLQQQAVDLLRRILSKERMP